MSTDEKYWADYDGLQNAKHQLLRKYLGGWFPILASWQGRVLYIDCHAGRGRHKTGDEGSPILALRLLLEHRQRAQILSSSEVHLKLFEVNEYNYRKLRGEIEALGPLPTNIYVHPFFGDYEAELRKTIKHLRSAGSQLAPCFAFVDPYGFTLSMELLNELLSFPQCEIMINLMYRYIDMAIRLPEQAANMDALFGSPGWREMLEVAEPSRRSEATISLFSQQLRAKYVTHMNMRAANGALKYVLIHATNHRRGRELMKQALWSITPDGSFSAFERDAPQQPVLILPDPDLNPLKKALWQQFAGRQVTINDIYDWLATQVYMPKHVHEVLRDYRHRGIVATTGYVGRFAFEKNPLISFPDEAPPEAM